MEFTWLAQTPQSRRRTRALRACASCQKRKKRCRHLSAEGLELGQAQSIIVQDSPKHKTASEQQHSASQPEGNSTDNHQSVRPRFSVPASAGISHIERFVGDLNPESVIREKIDDLGGTHLRDRVGLWINAPVQQAHEGYDAGVSDTSSILTGHSSRHDLETRSAASILQRRYSSALKACERLPRSTLDHLAAIYLSRVNRIIPLIDEESFTLGSKGPTSILLGRAVCLVAAKDKEASPHLRLVVDGPIVTARQFCSDIYTGLVSAMDAGLEPDRVTRIRILALMSLHSEGYEGAEAASMHLCQAIHQAQTAGLHLERPNHLRQDSLTALFWCLWTLDKMHACIGGRPILLADRDIGITKPNVKARRSKTAFDVWFALSDLLSGVISFYRPFADHTVGWETDYPAFEEIMGSCIRKDLDFATLGVLELYYHAVSILSCRQQPSHRPETSRPSYTRQGLAAVRIYSLVATECPQGLPPLPIVPYAVALSMGVSYQHFRSSKLITQFDRSKSSLEACCTLLENLGTYWYSAEAMARLGRKALHQIEGVNPYNYQHDLRSQIPSTSKDNDEGDIITSDPSTLATQGDALETRPLSPYYGGSQRSLDGVSSTAAGTEQPAPIYTDSDQRDIQQSGRGDGFADIDMLFGDFLDLSLPTNFWDPVFFSPEDNSNNI